MGKAHTVIVLLLAASLLLLACTAVPPAPVPPPIPAPASTPLPTPTPDSTPTNKAAETPSQADIIEPEQITTAEVPSKQPDSLHPPPTAKESPQNDWDAILNDLEFSGFTYSPVDFDTIFDTTLEIRWSRFSPFFNYSNTSHAEGPRKWYIFGPADRLVKVYLPAKAILKKGGRGIKGGIRITDAEPGREEYLNGEKVWVNLQAYFNVSSDIQIFYMHLTLRDEIKNKLENSSQGYAVFEAGTHIGYIYYPPWHSLDFGVEDRNKDSGLTRDPYHWWNIRANPLDYFTDELKQSILDKYQPIYDALKQEGVTPYSKLEDSRPNINIKDTFWGIWFKDDLSKPLGGDAAKWSIINFVKREYLHQETYWKAIEDNPTMAGLFTESTMGNIIGKTLYDGDPLGRSKFFILSGNEKEGVARINEGDTGWSDPRTVYLKYRFEENIESKFVDKLVLESFPTQEEAEASDFSDKAVIFRRTP